MKAGKQAATTVLEKMQRKPEANRVHSSTAYSSQRIRRVRFPQSKVRVVTAADDIAGVGGVVNCEHPLHA